jgi:ribosome biogenesis GTPase A
MLKTVALKGKKRNADRILEGKPERKMLLGRPNVGKSIALRLL